MSAEIPKKNAKPLTEPTVRYHKTIAAINETVSAATIVRHADSKLRNAEFLRVLPKRISSLMRSKNTMYESTAMPIDTIMPAMPESESAKPLVRDNKETTLHKNAIETLMPTNTKTAINL